MCAFQKPITIYNQAKISNLAGLIKKKSSLKDIGRAKETIIIEKALNNIG